MIEQTPKNAQLSPLAKVQVLEMGSTVAGPFCGRLLADFGAEVIKIEQREGDALRSMGSQLEGKSLYAASLFRNKKNISIDLRTESGQELVRDLVAQSDIVIENFRPGTLEKWGLGYEDLCQRNKGVILVRISGYGQSGPYSQRPGYGIICEAVSGLRHLTGEPGRPPVRVAVSMTDYITGLYAALGAMLALRAREETGRGQVVDASLFESAFSFMEPHIPAFQLQGKVAQPSGYRLPNNVPNTLFPTRDGTYIHIAAGGQGVFRRLADCMGQPDLCADARFATAVDRNRHSDEIEALISQWTVRQSIDDIETVLHAASVPAARIYDIKDIFNDPHYAARGAIIETPDDTLGDVAMAVPVPRLSDTPASVTWPGRGTGDDTEEVLASLLSLTPDRLRQLYDHNVIYSSGTDNSSADNCRDIIKKKANS